MIKKIKNIALALVTSSMLFGPALIPAVIGTAAADNITTSLCSGSNQASGGGQDGASGSSCGTAGSGSGTTDLSTIAGKIVNIFSVIVGIVAVIMIIYGGFRYITSGGDSGSVGNAKNTLIYAIVGLIIVALAQFIVHYVLNTAINNTPTS